ncbi:hypothetical protein RhiJN_05774 [Ceratobasidium sp. AG-Ba]|nr:hypothetical protein RhiJN_05774 [Ceratobasidium sp. AG-Ba]
MSDYDIIAEIQADGTRLYKLPRIQKRQTLVWDDLYAFCDVRDGSVICLQVTEVHRVRNKTGRAEHQVFRGNISDSVSMICSDGGKSMFVVHMRIMGKDLMKKAYTEALDAAKVMSRNQSIGRSSRTGEAFKKIMALNRVLLDPTGGAEAAFWVCTKAWEHFEAQEQQSATVDDLLTSLGSVIPSAESVKHVAGTNLRETLTEIEKLVEDASIYILGVRSRSRSGGSVYRMISSGTPDQLDALVRRSQRLRQEFEERMIAQTLDSSEKHAHRERLKELGPAPLSAYNPSRCCLDGTRLGVINSLTSWVSGKSTEARLAWVHGLAGLGKSSIMTSVCKLLDDQGLLACSFFCKRDSSELRDPRQVLMTVISELAQRWDAYGVAVSKAIGENLGLQSKHIQPLYDLLVAKPWKAIAEEDRPSETLAVVIDALDESVDAAARRQLLVCLRDMSKMMPFIRVIVASRPDDDIRSFFVGTDTSWYSEFNLLQYDAGQDIHRFVQQSLSSLSSVKDWPPDAIDRVAERAGGLFIWARTACAYILSGLDKLKRFKLLTDGKHMLAIDQLYGTILTEDDTIGDEESAEELRSYLGMIIVSSTRRAVSVEVLGALMGARASRTAIQGAVNRLSSVLYIDDTFGGVIRVSHPSFMDYLIDQTRSKDWYVDLAEHNTTFASACLQTMRDELKFNICALETSDRFNRDIADLEARTQRAISPQLIYACEFWSSHLSDSPAGSLGPFLHEFLSSPVLMYWLEALSLLGKLSVAPSSLLRVAEWCTTHHLDDCYGMAQDAYRFVLAFYDPIATSAPHLYISALSMAPANSQISQRMRKYFPNLAAVVDPINSDWTSCIRSISAGSAVYSVAMSPDDKRIASGCVDGKVRVWDAETGEAVLVPLQGHSMSVRCVAFSGEGRRIASGSADGTILICDARTGEGMIGPLRAHTYNVSAIAWSYDDSIIASGSEDTTINLWSSRTGAVLLGPLQGSRSVNCLAFSDDDRMLASGCEDFAVRVWDTKNGSLMLEIVNEVVYPAAIRFSREGQRLMLNAGGRMIQTWDVATHDEIISLQNYPLGGWPASAFLTRNNSRVVYTFRDAVKLWDVNQNQAVHEPFLGHSREVSSVTCPSGGDRIISGSHDATIRIWDISAAPSSMSSTASVAYPNSEHSSPSPVVLAAFSLDARLIASAHLNDTIWVWNAETGRAVVGPLEDLPDSPESIAFTSGDRVVSCALSGGILYSWDIGSGQLVHKMAAKNDSGPVHAGIFSTDGQLLATVPKSHDDSVRIRSVADGTVILRQPPGLLDPTRIAAFSPDNRNIAFVSKNRTLHVWDVQTGNALFDTVAGHSKDIRAVSYSPDGLRIASGSSDPIICIWNARTGELLMTLCDNTCVKLDYMVFSHDGHYIVSGSAHGKLNIWDTMTGHMVFEYLLGYEGYLGPFVISPNNHILYTADDGFIRLVDLTLYLRPDLPVRSLPGTNIATLPDNLGEGRLMVSAGQLARHLDDSIEGWVTGSNGRPLMWLPHELRQLDDSYMRISPAGPQLRRIDFTRFMHGKEWTNVKRE